jgi:adenylosuccinate synthase
MPVTLVVGGQWGDEGKAKIIDYLARGMDFVVRYQGGANAGHTVVVGSEKFAFRQVPSGILYPRVTCVLGGGMVIDPHALIEEIDGIRARGVDVDGRILVSEQAHLVLPYHVLLDCARASRRRTPTRRAAKASAPPISRALPMIFASWWKPACWRTTRS